MEIACRHKNQEKGHGWAKCLDCGAKYGWPGILPEPQDPQNFIGQPMMTFIFINESA